MEYLPLFFSFSDLVSCCEAKAIIEVRGRALMRKEDGLWWITAVSPAGFAASGSDPKEAFAAFRRTFIDIIKDMAEEAEGPEQFKTEVNNFAKSVHRINEERWKSARRLIREGKAQLCEELRTLKTVKEEIPVTISVVLVRHVRMKKTDIIASQPQYSKAA